jgi:hypothetical protein
LVAVLCVSAISTTNAGLLLRMAFDDMNTATTTALSSPGGYVFDLQDAAGSAAALQNVVGVSGNVGDYAFNGSAATGMGSGDTGPRAVYNSAGANPDLATGSLASFTISGWYRTDVGQQLKDLARLLGSSTMTLQGGGSANTELTLSFTSTAGAKSTGSTSFSTAYSPIATWVYFAVTHDSNITGGPNTFFYAGSQSSSVSLVNSATISSPAPWVGWTTASDGPVWANAHASAGGIRPFDGYLDDLRVYGESTGGGGALSLAALETGRLESLAVPEPSVAILGLLGAGVLFRRQRKSL